MSLPANQLYMLGWLGSLAAHREETVFARFGHVPAALTLSQPDDHVRVQVRLLFQA